MKKKKPYKKPELAKVELKPEDAVLTACKATGTFRVGQKCRSSAALCNTSTKGS